jgi:hypothetical protein
MMVLKSVGVLSAGKVSGALCALLGLLIGGVMAMFSLAGVALQAQAQGGGPQIPTVFLGVGALILVPIFYGVVGFITGIIYAALYNMIASVVGGIELEFDHSASPINAP